MILLLFALVICPGNALAASEIPIPGMDELTDALPEETAPMLSGVSPEELPKDGIWKNLLQTAWEKVRSSAADICRTGGILLCVCVLVSLTDTLDLGSRAPPYITFAAVAVIGTATISDFRSYVSMGTETLQTLSDYSHVLLPVLSSAAAATGAAGSAAAKYAATAVCMDVLLSASRNVLGPCICGYAALSVADAAVGNEILKTAKKIMKTICTTLLSGVCVAFTAWLSLTGVVTGTADALAARVTKTAVSAALPVVGSILSDAASTLAAAAGTLKATIGIFGLLAIAAICLPPVLMLGVRFLIYKLTAAVCECVADKRFSELISNLGTAFALLLAINGAGAMMLFLSLYSLIQTVV